MYAGVSHLGSLLTGSVGSATVCSSVLDNTGSYSSGFISRCGREPVSNTGSSSVSA